MNPDESPPHPDAAVAALKAWRTRNRLSQRGAAETFAALGGPPINRAMVAQYEQGWRRPSPAAVQALASFLAAHPLIADPCHYRPGRKRSFHW